MTQLFDEKDTFGISEIFSTEAGEQFLLERSHENKVKK